MVVRQEITVTVTMKNQWRQAQNTAKIVFCGQQIKQIISIAQIVVQNCTADLDIILF